MGALPGNTDATTPPTHGRTAYVPVPGLVYLRRPGRHAVPVTQDAPASEAAPVQDAASRRPGSAVNARVAMLVGVWLEVVDGRRPVSALRKGPFSPRVTEDLRGRMRQALPAAARVSGASGTASSPAVPSRVLSVHLPPTHPERLTFTASVLHHERVRAVVGHLARYEGRWRVETVTMV